MKLGFISEKFESGGRGPGVISVPGDDPGGKSYGIYQLSKQTLWRYTQQSPFKFKAVLFTQAFDNEWVNTAQKYKDEFALDQYLFITQTIYLPNIIYAKSVGFVTSSRKVQEVVFSIAVQHGGAAQIVKDAFSSSMTVEHQIYKLYASRLKYVKSLGLSDSLKSKLFDRYKHELAEVLKIQEF